MILLKATQSLDGKANLVEEMNILKEFNLILVNQVWRLLDPTIY